MSYIDIINAFWNWRKVNELNSKGTDLFFALLDCANSCAWKAEFTAPNSMLMAMCQMSKNDLFRCRNALIQKGLIDYKPGRRGQAGLYTVLIGINISPKYGTNSDTNKRISPKYGTNIDTNTGTNTGTNTDTNPDTNSGTIHREDKTRQEKNLNISPLPPPAETENSGGNKTFLPPPELKMDADLAEIFQAWERASGRCSSIAQSEELQALAEEHGKDNLLYAIKQGVDHNAVTLAYIRAVLKGSRKRQQPKSYSRGKSSKFVDVEDDLL